jgi:hypothetical protein
VGGALSPDNKNQDSRNKTLAGRNKIKAKRNEIKAGRNKIQISNRFNFRAKISTFQLVTPKEDPLQWRPLVLMRAGRAGRPRRAARVRSGTWRGYNTDSDFRKENARTFCGLPAFWGYSRGQAKDRSLF